MVICTRPGCGVDFDPSSSASSGSGGEGSGGQGPCTYHPGAPIFHEGRKSWSCCEQVNKPVLDFDEFLAIKGCTTEEAHTNVKKEKPAPPTASSSAASATAGANGSSPGPVKIEANGTEVYGAAKSSAVPATGSTQTMAKSTASAGGMAKAKEVEEAQDDDTDEIAAGSTCKRNGCKATFAGGARDKAAEECRYHRGTAIFHEGSKGYSCCRRRVLEFDEFLNIEPCTTSKRGHLFTDPSARKLGKLPSVPGQTLDEEKVDCRIDHYETPADVRVTVYAKGVDVPKSKIDLSDEAVVFSLALPPVPASSTTARRFNKTLEPFAEIDANASSFTVSRFKVDLILVKKVQGESWPTLERGQNFFGYGLTFGRAKDAPPS